MADRVRSKSVDKGKLKPKLGHKTAVPSSRRPCWTTGPNSIVTEGSKATRAFWKTRLNMFEQGQKIGVISPMSATGVSSDAS